MKKAELTPTDLLRLSRLIKLSKNITNFDGSIFLLVSYRSTKILTSSYREERGE